MGSGLVRGLLFDTSNLKIKLVNFFCFCLCAKGRDHMEGGEQKECSAILNLLVGGVFQSLLSD